jgi:hypothetical protein
MKKFAKISRVGVDTIESLVEASSTRAERDQGVARRRGRRPYHGFGPRGSHHCSWASHGGRSAGVARWLGARFDVVLEHVGHIRRLLGT